MDQWVIIAAMQRWDGLVGYHDSSATSGWTSGFIERFHMKALCTTSEDHYVSNKFPLFIPFIPLSVSRWNDLIVTPCSMVWDWRVSRAGPMPFYWPCCSLTFRRLLFSISLLLFYRLMLWGWGLRTDRVLIALYQSSIANLF